MDALPPELLAPICTLACTDGRTGAALALVSRRIHQVSRYARFDAVALHCCSTGAVQVEQLRETFLLERERAAAAREGAPPLVVRHLSITWPGPDGLRADAFRAGPADFEPDPEAKGRSEQSDDVHMHDLDDDRAWITNGNGGDVDMDDDDPMLPLHEQDFQDAFEIESWVDMPAEQPGTPPRLTRMKHRRHWEREYWMEPKVGDAPAYGRAIARLLNVLGDALRSFVMMQSPWGAVPGGINFAMRTVERPFPHLQELTLHGGHPPLLNLWRSRGTAPPFVLYPGVRRLHHAVLFAHQSVHLEDWAVRAPNVTHLRVTILDEVDCPAAVTHLQTLVSSLWSTQGDRDLWPHLQYVAIDVNTRALEDGLRLRNGPRGLAENEEIKQLVMSSLRALMSNTQRP